MIHTLMVKSVCFGAVYDSIGILFQNSSVALVQFHFHCCFPITPRVQLFATLWTAAHQVSLSLTTSQNLPKFMSTALVMLSIHLILWCPLILLPSIFPRSRDFSNESAVHIRWPKYWSFSISPSNEYSGLISFRIDWFSRVFSNTTVQDQFFYLQFSL